MMKLIVKAQVSDKESKDFTYEFDQPVVTLGRLKENDIQLPLSTVSGYHAQILQEGDTYYLLDRGSINGTFLNRQRIPSGERKLLRDGDVIRVQTFEIYFSTGAMMKIDQGATVQVARQMVMEVLGSWEAQSKEKPRLIIMGGPNGGKQIELAENKNIVIGRGSNCEIVIDHPSVSRRHAEITFTWNGAFVKDLNSANGVYCNDRKISGSQKLHDRDELQMGQQEATDPIRIVVSNPAEALLAKIDEAQISDSNPGVAEEKKVTDIPEGQATKSGSNLPAALPGSSTVAATPVAVADAAAAGAAVDQQPAVASDRFIIRPKEPEPRELPVGLIVALVGTVVVLLGAGLWYYFSRTNPAVFGEMTPEKAATGETVTIHGKNLDGAGIQTATIEQRNAPIVAIESQEVKVKIPAFPQEEPSERTSQIILQNAGGTIHKFPFTLIIPPQLRSVDPTSGKIGTEVKLEYSGGRITPKVFFGNKTAVISSAGTNHIICTVPDIPGVPGEGLKVPVTIRVNDIPSRSNTTFTILAEPGLEAVNPTSAQPGAEVHVITNVTVENPAVYFGTTKATVTPSSATDLVAVVPKPAEIIPPKGLKVPVSIRSGDTELKNKIDFTIIPGPVLPPEVFQLSFSAKPFSGNLGFNEYSVNSNIGPFLLIVGKDVYGSSDARAEAVAKTLSDAVDFFKRHSDANIVLVKEENYSLYAEAPGDRRLLLHVFPEDAVGYGKMSQRVVSVDDLAQWWKMLIESYYRVFVQIRNPADTGILSSGGGILQNVVNFFAVANQSGEKYYRKDFLDTMPEDQKSRLVALSFSLPQRISSVQGKWAGSMTNILFSNISEPNLELLLTLQQNQDGSISGKADVNWRVSFGGKEGEFQNSAFKKLGTYQLSGSYDKTKSYPVEFSFTEKEQGKLNFVGRIEGNALRGSFVIGATGEDGTWIVKSKQ